MPQACRENSIFVISSNCLKNVEDIKGNMNGVFRTCHEVKSKRVQVNDTIVTVKPSSINEIVQGELVMKINRRENEHGLVRNIIYLVNEKKEVINSKKLLQYYINSKVAGNKSKVQYTPSSHGNCRNAEKSFFPLKKSTLNRFRSQVYQKGKRKIGNLYDAEMNANNDYKDYGNFPRSKKQLIDLSRSQLADNEVGDILAYNEELGSNGIIWHHSDIPDDLWVLGTNVMTNELSNATKVLPTSVDPTFSFGRYEVTPFIYGSVALNANQKTF